MIRIIINFKYQIMRSNILNSVLIAALLLPLTACEQPAAENDAQASGLEDFLGHWSFDIDGGWVGWLGVTQEDNYLDAELLWKWGSVTPVANVFLTGDGVLHVTRTSRRQRGTGNEPRVHMITSWMEAESDGETISGYFLEPRGDGMGVDSTWFEGPRLPEVPPAPDLDALEYGEPVELFNGRDLTGWELIEENRVNGFRAVNGVLYNDAKQTPGEPAVSYGNLRTIDEFEDFNLTLDVNIPQGSNSGVYLRGIYEIQVLDSYGREPNDHNMGAVYSRITPSEAAERPAGEWQTMDITLADRHVTVILNGVKIIDNEPVYGPTGGALQSDVFAPGPIFLQGDHGPVSFRNMVLTPIIN
jgi:hypothetical protein